MTTAANLRAQKKGAGETPIPLILLILANFKVVGARGFEPPTPASRTQYSTRLSYAPTETTTALEGPSNSEEA